MLLSVDNYYNLQLADTEEWIDGAMAGNLGEVLIRCVLTDVIDQFRPISGRHQECVWSFVVDLRSDHGRISELKRRQRLPRIPRKKQVQQRAVHPGSARGRDGGGVSAGIWKGCVGT